MELRLLPSPDSLTRIALVGSLDLAGVGRIDLKFTALTVGQGKPTIVDLSELSFLSSLGMGLLVSCHKGLRTKGAKLVLLNPQVFIEEALTVARLNTLLTIAHDEDEALRLVGLGETV